ncbi:MAG: hemin-degrading factor [Sumerlaeia bacterium]
MSQPTLDLADFADLREKVARKLEANPSIKTAMLADALGVREDDVLRAMPDGYATELDPAQAEAIVREIELLGTLYVVVRNPMTVIEVTGKFGGFSQSGPFFNVATERLHMHLRLDRVAAIFAVQPPAKDDAGPSMTSIQFFDADGASGLKTFLLPSAIEAAGESLEANLAAWAALRDRFVKA